MAQSDGLWPGHQGEPRTASRAQQAELVDGPAEAMGQTEREVTVLINCVAEGMRVPMRRPLRSDAGEISEIKCVPFDSINPVFHLLDVRRRGVDGLNECDRVETEGRPGDDLSQPHLL